MGQFRIVGARPKGEKNHLKSEFRVFEWAVDPQDGKKKWMGRGWKSIHVISDLIEAGSEVKTGSIADGTMETGADLEIELRIAHNKVDFKIDDMPVK